MVLEILNNGRIHEDMSKTFISLIQKGKNPNTPKYFIPISLCNVTMKNFTKTIANRLKPILSYLVGEEQSVFVKYRLISDNGLIVMEFLHWMKN